MGALVALLTVAVISLLIVRIGAIALSMTGLDLDVGRLQAQSAFTGAGFTTAESELVIGHPVRRKIIRLLMLLGNVGFTSVVATLILSFLTAESSAERFLRLGLIIAGLALLWWLSRTRAFNDWLNRVIRKALSRSGALDPKDYARLLRIRRGYTIAEVEIEPGEWLEGKTLMSAQLRQEGVTVLGIERQNGTFLGVPDADTELEAGDRLTVYGAEEALRELADRRADWHGEQEHQEAVQEAKTRREREREADARREKEAKAARAAAEREAAGRRRPGDAGDDESPEEAQR